MNELIRLLREELILEAGSVRMVNKPPALVDLCRKISAKDRYMDMILNSDHCNWYYNPDPRYTASIGMERNEDKLRLTFGPRTINGDLSVLAFTLAHEFAHFFRDHLTGNAFRSMPNHDAANISMDACIDDDILNKGSLFGIPLKVPFPVYTLKLDSYRGEKMNCLETLAKEKYEGAPIAKSVYSWYLQNEDKIKDSIKKKQPPKEPGEGGEGEGEGGDEGGGGGSGEGEGGGSGGGGGQDKPYFPKVGDIVRNDETGEYAKVTSVNPDTNQITGVIPFANKEAAEAEVAKGSAKLVSRLVL